MTRVELESNKAICDTLVVIPTFNEKENITEIVNAALRKLPCDVLVVDDDSPDGTAKFVADGFKGHPRVLLVSREGKRRGLGLTYRDGFQIALAKGYSFVIQMDADFSHSPEYLPVLRRAAERVDLAIGSRYVTGGKTPGWSRLRRFISMGGSWYARQVLSVPVKDLTGGFKCWKAKSLSAIDLGSLSSKGFLFQIETTYRACRAGLNVVEVPIVFSDRTKGVSKMSWTIFLEALFKVWWIRAKRWK